MRRDGSALSGSEGTASASGYDLTDAAPPGKGVPGPWDHLPSSYVHGGSVIGTPRSAFDGVATTSSGDGGSSNSSSAIGTPATSVSSVSAPGTGSSLGLLGPSNDFSGMLRDGCRVWGPPSTGAAHWHDLA